MTNYQFVKITQIPSDIQGFALNKINFLSKLRFYPSACFFFFFFYLLNTYVYIMLPLLFPQLLEQMQTLKNDQALPYH